jgi:hypothetical protein
MADHDDAFLLDEARRLAKTGPVSPAGRIAYRAAAAAVPGRPEAVVAALLRLAEQDRDLGLHALAAAQRAARDAEIRRMVPDPGELRQAAASRPALRQGFVTRSRA